MYGVVMIIALVWEVWKWDGPLTAHKNVRCDMFYHKKSFQILETFMFQQIMVFPPPPHFPTLAGPASTGIHRASYVDCPRGCVLAIENYLESECSG